MILHDMCHNRGAASPPRRRNAARGHVAIHGYAKKTRQVYFFNFLSLLESRLWLCARAHALPFLTCPIEA